MVKPECEKKLNKVAQDTKRILRYVKDRYATEGKGLSNKGYLSLHDSEVPEEMMEMETGKEVLLTVKAKVTDISRNRYGDKNEEHKSVSFQILDLDEWE